MREVKFRIWDNEDKYIKKVDSIDFPLGKPSGKDVCVYNQQEDYYEWIYDYELMEYTGLKDKNEVEIYEGDIVKTKRASNIKGLVVMYKATWCIYDGYKYYKLYDNFVEINSPIEVIGNIYENPELLEKV